MTDLLIWRHGQTEWNASRRVQGQLDSALDETGLAQARLYSSAIAARNPTLIISSDLKRASVTAQALADVTGLPVQLDPRLRERFYGPWQGLTSDEIRARNPDLFATWRTRAEEDLPGIESLDDLGKRAAAAFADAASQASSGVAVIVSHGGAIRAGVAAFLGWPVEAGQTLRVLLNCHLAHLRHTDRFGWDLSAYNTEP